MTVSDAASAARPRTSTTAAPATTRSTRPVNCYNSVGSTVHFDLNAGLLLAFSGTLTEVWQGFEHYDGSASDPGSSVTVTGTTAANTILTTHGNDTINGLDGGDYISTEGGLDLVFGGLGSDTLYAGANNDTLNGGADDDTLYGGAGFDILDYDGIVGWRACLV